MDDLFLYFIKVLAGSMLFYLCYILFLSKDTFYLRNRILLIMILVLPVIIPLLRFLTYASVSTIENTNPVTTFIYSGSILGATMEKKITMFDSDNLKWIYFTIAGLFFLRLIVSLIQTGKIISKGKTHSEKFPKIVLTEMEITPFSFFPYVVIPSELLKSDAYNEIIAHEKAHVRQGHTFDLLLCELLIVIFWFNPFLWLIKRSLVLNHEYLADNYSIKNSSSIKEYQYKLLNIRKDLINIPLAHTFSSLIKNRIVMINKKPSPNYASLKSILILPAAAILFVMFSFRQEPVQVNKDYMFSKTSDSEILVFLASNTGYPQEARNSLDTGKIFVTVKINKAGIIKECKAFNNKSEIKIPFLPEIVIVGKKPLAFQAAGGKDHSLLKIECQRVANRLSELKIPEWKDKEVEFAVTYKFILQ
jgi:hypothetical protein